MGKGKKARENANELKKTSEKKNKNIDTSLKQATKPSSKGESSRICRASSLKGKQSQPLPNV
ncbi:hypothetical protein A2U01_0084025, partial [Trifolium medium]|nr:hypothetical protein [Trifolium medium]